MMCGNCFGHKTNKKSSLKIDQAPSITHDLNWVQEQKHIPQKEKNDIQAVIRLSESITLSWLLIGEAERELPGDRPAANHTPEEPLLNYKLEPPLSVTQRNQRTEGCKSHTRYNIWKAQSTHVHLEKNRPFLLMCAHHEHECLLGKKSRFWRYCKRKKTWFEQKIWEKHRKKGEILRKMFK